MTRRAWKVAICCSLLWSVSAHAQTTHVVSIWYRSAQGCPEADAFLSKLSARNVRSRLAQVGDTIDFVVTLGVGPDGRGRGVLERQTQTGTVAIRKVEDAGCEPIADALALTLALSIDGDAAEGQASAAATATAAVLDVEAPSRGTAPALRGGAASPTAGSGAVAVGEPARPSAAATVSPARATPSPERTMRWALGIQGGVTTGLIEELLPAGAVFVELRLEGAGVVRPTLRLAALVASGSQRDASDKQRSLDLQIFAARGEGCPIRFGGAVLQARPCLALELGQLRVEGQAADARKDSDIWAAAAALARLTLIPLEPLVLEAQLGVVVPFARYEFLSDAGASSARRTAVLGLTAGFGVGVELP